MQDAAKLFFEKYPKRFVRAHELVLSGHAQPHEVFYLASGRIRQYSISSITGNLLTIHVYHPGSYFPLMYTLGNKTNHFFFDAFEDSSMHVAPAEEVEKFLKTHPEAAYELNQRLLAGLEGVASRLEVMAFTDVYGRLLSQLLYLARHYGHTNGSDNLEIGRYTHQQLSEFMGVTREATSIAFKKLENAGLVIHVSHTISIPDLDKLEAEFRRHTQRP